MAAHLFAHGACMPPSVRAVDHWLEGLEQGDVDRVVAWSHPADRALVARALEARASDPTSLLALAMPPTPLDHYFVGIERKSADGNRHVVHVELTLENPLPRSSERIGHPLPGIPATRVLDDRFLSVRLPSGDWRVQLDLPAVVARARRVEAFQAALADGAFGRAEALLEDVPPPPDEPDAQASSDRLVEALRAELARARRKTRTSTSADAADASSAARGLNVGSP